MSGSQPSSNEAIRARWDERAQRYDTHYETFKGAVEHHVDWELLRRHLPTDRSARILDAAGGTGRITLPLAKMGYAVTLCDISPRMLNVARQKLLKEGIPDRVDIFECDVRNLRFANESFDFVLCWNGMIEAAREVIRVTKKGGGISIFLVNRCRGAVDLFPESPASALALIESRSEYVYDEEERYRAVSPEEAQKFFAAQGIRVVDIYAVCGWTDLLRIPPELRESSKWDEGFFSQVTEMVLKLSQEPSVKGMSRHLVLYGERT
jgi:ubiquinone/menaquinone biosynthesis C-methylase UbiE